MNDVYLITDTINHKFYVGVTCQGYLHRYRDHINSAKNGSAVLLHEAMRKYGYNNFKVELLESNVPDSKIASRERYYIRKYHSYYLDDCGYNMTHGGCGVAGYHHTELSKQKMRESMKHIKFSESRNQKISEALRGKHKTLEHRRALSSARLGRFHGEDNPFYNKHHSESTKSVLREDIRKYDVFCIDDDQNIIHSFHGICEAARWVISEKLSSASVSTCARRILTVAQSDSDSCTAYTYHWKVNLKSID